MARPSASRILDRSPIVLIKHALDTYRMEVWPSFAPHVGERLARVRAEIALGI